MEMETFGPGVADQFRAAMMDEPGAVAILAAYDGKPGLVLRQNGNYIFLSRPDALALAEGIVSVLRELA